MSEQVADAPSNHWVYARAPQGARPYLQMMRADRPIGWWLLLLPGWQGIALAALADGWRWLDLWLFVGFFIGAVAMRGAGCVLNDLADRDIDAKVARTRSRPLPSGRITPRKAALFLGALLLVGALIALSLNAFAFWLCVLALGPVMIYPFMKRVTYWPQLFLGVAFNWGALAGWAAHTGGLGWPPILLYLGGICWTIGYDTIYAHQDREDDALIGVKSTALLFGQRTKPIMTAFYGAAWLLAAFAGIMAGGFGLWLLLGLGAYGAHLLWQIRALNIDDPENCLRLFRANRNAGLLLLAGFVGASLF